MTKVPVKGAWISCFFVSFVCFFLDLEELSKIISLGNLLSYSVVNAGAIALRFREPETASLEVSRSKPEIFAWLYILFAFLFSMSVGYSFAYCI